MINGFLSQDFSELLIGNKLEPSLFCFDVSLDYPHRSPHVFLLQMQKNGLTEPVFKLGQ